MKFIVVQGLIALCFFSLTEQKSCGKDDVSCDDGSCIPRYAWCDGDVDCADKSDEKYCKEGSWFDDDPNKCKDNSEHFKCEDGRCYPKGVQCDGYRDCNDGSDEKNCPVDATEAAVVKKKEAEKPDESTAKPDVEGSSEEESSEEDSDEEDSAEDDDADNSYNEIENDEKPFVAELTKGIKWLLSVRKPNYGWGHSTARALIALGLTKPTFFSQPNEDANLMKKQLQIQLAIDFVRNHSEPVTLSRLSLYINAMLAICEDPGSFHGLNLVQDLRHRVTTAYHRRRRTTHEHFVNPVAHLSLCLVGESSESDVHKLTETLNVREDSQRWIDMQYISVMALSCIVENYSFGRSYTQTLQSAVNDILKRENRAEGSFGNIYSTALAVQALLSARSYSGWNPSRSLQYLADHQLENGSFGDLLSTYYILPVLAKKSLASLKKTLCPKALTRAEVPLDALLDYQGPRHYVRYSLYYGNPVEVSYSVLLHVPVNTTFFNVMRLAEHTDPKFKFQYEREPDGAISVYAIGGIPNDAERGIYWQLFANLNLRHGRNQLDRTNSINLQRYIQGVHRLVPKGGDHVAFWYRPIGQ